MKKSIFQFLFASIAFLFLLPGQTWGQKLENSLLWEISGKGLAKPSYLFGTYHLLNDSYLSTKAPKALEAFRQSDGVVVETVLDTPSLMNAQIHMVMFDNKLSKLLDSASYRLVGEEIKQTMGADIAAFDQLKPMAISTMLTIVYATSATPEVAQYTGKPLDMYFAEEGGKQKKTVTPFEAVEEQMKILFNHFTLEQQAKQLIEMVSMKTKAIDIQKSIVASYTTQNIQAMHDVSEQMQKEMPAFGSLAFITTDRNKRWMEKLPAILQSGSQFVAVGALHLPGPDGLIDLLRKQGYTVKAVL